MGHKFRPYNTENEYLSKLDEINAKFGYPSKDYSKIIKGKRIYFKSDKIMTRTYASETPTRTSTNKYVFPVLNYASEDFDLVQLVDYNKGWYLNPELPK